MCVRLPDDCAITDLQFVSKGDTSDFNLDPKETTKPLYFKDESSEHFTMVYSKQADKMPVTNVKLFERPCMDPYIQTSSDFYQLELK